MKRWPTILVHCLVMLFLIFLGQKHILRGEVNTSRERVHLSDHEAQIYRFILDHILQEGSVPTQEQIDTPLSRPLDDDVRAKLSAKLYYEQGIIGALLSDDETRVLTLLFHYRRGLGSIGTLTDRIRRDAGNSISSLRVVRILEFLYAAGYIDARDGGENVYLVLPKDLETLYSASLIEKERGPDNPFENVRVHLSRPYPREETVAPVAIGEPKRSLEREDTGRSVPIPSSEGSPLVTSTSPEETASTEETMHLPPVAESPQKKPEDDFREEAEEELPETFETSQAISASSSPETEPYPEPVVTVASQDPLGPPVPKSPLTTKMEPETVVEALPQDSLKSLRGNSLSETENEEYSGFPSEVLRKRGKLLMPCAPDFWGWPYLYGQKNFDILAFTSDTGAEVRISVKDGRLIASQPRNVLVLNEGQHKDIRFFLSEEGFRSWQRSHPDIEGKIMTLPEALSWAKSILHVQ